MVAALGAVLGFYIFTAATSGFPIGFGSHQQDYYNQLSDALLHGRAALLKTPPRGLLALKDPYDPIANAHYRATGAHDLSLYHGRYYLYWGPTPALTLFIPFRALPFLGDMSEPAAVVIYSFVGLVFSLLLLSFLVRRYLPETPGWVRLLAAAALALGNTAPFVLRRPIVYEIAISAGYCFLFAGLYFLCTGSLRDRPNYLRLALGSVSLGLAVGARPVHVLACLVAPAVLILLIRSGRAPDRRAIATTAAALLGPLVVIGVLLATYNKVRFDSFTEFGTHYMLSGVDTPKRKIFDPAYVPPGLYYYVLAPVRWVTAFPYAVLPPPPAYPGHVPAQYDGVEMTGGVLANMPILLSLFAIPLVWVRASGNCRQLRWILAGAALLGLVYVVLISAALWGTTQRYEMDFSSLLLVAALLTWSVLLLRLRDKRWVRRGVAIAGTVLIGYGALVGAALGFTGYYDSLRLKHPAIFRSLERFFSPLPTLVTMVIGHPEISRIDNSLGYSLPSVTYNTHGPGNATFWMNLQPATVTVTSPKSERIALRATVARGPDVRPSSRVTLVVRSSHSTTRLRVSGSSTLIPVKLGTGLNDIRLRVITSKPPPLPATNPAAGQVVSVSNLVIAPGSG